MGARFFEYANIFYELVLYKLFYYNTHSLLCLINFHLNTIEDIHNTTATQGEMRIQLLIDLPENVMAPLS